MTRTTSAVLACVTLSALALAGCGAGSSPSQPAPAPTVAPTTPPATTPTLPFSSIPPCALAASNPANPSCTKPTSRLAADVNAAIDRVITQRPDLFDLADINGGPRILNYEKYMIAVVSSINQAGLCGKVDAEGEIGIKLTNTYNEQWIIASRAGWNPPTGNWVQRKYVGACVPSVF